MLQHLDELRDIQKKYNLNPDDIIVVGSGSITEIGGRLNSDIEFCVKKQAKCKIPLRIRMILLFIDHYDLSDNVDLFANRYLSLGVYDSDLEKNNCYHTLRNTEFFIVNPEYELGYKQKRMWPKDVLDLKNIEDSPEIKEKIDYRQVALLIEKKGRFVDRFYYCFKKKMWNYYSLGSRAFRKIKKISA